MESWTVVRRKRRGDPYWHRVPDLVMDWTPATDLVKYLTRTEPMYEWEVVGQFDHTIMAKKIRNVRGKTKVRTVEQKINDNARLPFDTDPRGAAEREAEAKAKAEHEAKQAALIEAFQLAEKAKREITWFTSADAKADPYGGYQVIPVGPEGTGWFNVYHGRQNIGELDYSPSISDRYRELPWVATLYAWKLDGATQDMDISAMGRYADKDSALKELIERREAIEGERQ